jgi:hypothetical protein
MTAWWGSLIAAYAAALATGLVISLAVAALFKEVRFSLFGTLSRVHSSLAAAALGALLALVPLHHAMKDVSGELILRAVVGVFAAVFLLSLFASLYEQVKRRRRRD